MDDLLDRGELLGDPQADVGRAGDDRRIGMSRVELRQGLLARRCGKKGAIIPDEEIGLVVERTERLQPRGGAPGEPIVGRLGAGFQGGIDDRPVSRASAQVSGEHIVDCFAGRRAVAGMVVGEQAHHDARRAKAALRAVLSGHRRLDRMQLAVIGEVFDGDQLRAIKLAEQRDARIDRLIDQAAAMLAHDHSSAGPAVAFGAAFLGADRTFAFAQPVEDRRARQKFVEAHDAAASEKLQTVSGHLPAAN